MFYALPKEEKYPIETKEQVKLACDYFDKAYTKLEPVVRAIYAANVEKRAMQVGFDVKSNAIVKYAKASRQEDYDNIIFKQAMSLRRDACTGREKEISLINQIEKFAADSQEDCKILKLMSAISDFDKYAGLDLYYDSQIPDPISSLYDDRYTMVIDFGKEASYSATALCAKKDDEDVLKKIASIYGRQMRDDFQVNPIRMVSSLNDLGKRAFYEKVLA